ncbi:hypothetical protein B0H19DRAFT_1239180 [Mycena capillaripes]|nr:hypothetical protein B0H19DRAFT_1239180 [Mycena capillaripes]
MNSLLSGKTAHRSAVKPYGAFKCKIKLRRGALRKGGRGEPKKMDRLDGAQDVRKEIQRIAEVIVKERVSDPELLSQAVLLGKKERKRDAVDGDRLRLNTANRETRAQHWRRRRQHLRMALGCKWKQRRETQKEIDQRGYNKHEYTKAGHFVKETVDQSQVKASNQTPLLKWSNGKMGPKFETRKDTRNPRAGNTGITGPESGVRARKPSRLWRAAPRGQMSTPIGSAPRCGAARARARTGRGKHGREAAGSAGESGAQCRPAVLRRAGADEISPLKTPLSYNMPRRALQGGGKRGKRKRRWEVAIGGRKRHTRRSGSPKDDGAQRAQAYLRRCPAEMGCGARWWAAVGPGVTRKEEPTFIGLFEAPLRWNEARRALEGGGVVYGLIEGHVGLKRILLGNGTSAEQPCWLQYGGGPAASCLFGKGGDCTATRQQEAGSSERTGVRRKLPKRIHDFEQVCGSAFTSVQPPSNAEPNFRFRFRHLLNLNLNFAFSSVRFGFELIS